MAAVREGPRALVRGGWEAAPWLGNRILACCLLLQDGAAVRLPLQCGCCCAVDPMLEGSGDLIWEIRQTPVGLTRRLFHKCGYSDGLYLTCVCVCSGERGGREGNTDQDGGRWLQFRFHLLLEHIYVGAAGTTRGKEAFLWGTIWVGKEELGSTAEEGMTKHWTCSFDLRARLAGRIYYFKTRSSDMEINDIVVRLLRYVMGVNGLIGRKGDRKGHRLPRASQLRIPLRIILRAGPCRPRRVPTFQLSAPFLALHVISAVSVQISVASSACFLHSCLGLLLHLQYCSYCGVQ
jgi:hypothetical protein